MSFVGTRPETVKYVDKYKPEYMATLLLPAGITSEASIRYKDEATLRPCHTYGPGITSTDSRANAQVYGKYNTTPYDKLKLDLTYIETYSLKLDLKLLMLTFKILFQKENTEGLEVWQRTAGQENKNKDSREL